MEPQFSDYEEKVNLLLKANTPIITISNILNKNKKSIYNTIQRIKRKNKFIKIKLKQRLKKEKKF